MMMMMMSKYGKEERNVEDSKDVDILNFGSAGSLIHQATLVA